MLGETRVSVVSVFYNRGAFVRDSVESLLTQTLQNIEIIIVNDGSTDDTATRLDEINDERLRVIHQENAGFTAAIRRAVSECRSAYVAVHGAGDISLPKRLELQAAYLDENERVGIIGCRYSNDGVIFRPQSTAVERGPVLDTFMVRSRTSHGEAMFRKALYDKVGGYRAVFTYAQDRDLWLRMGKFCDYAVLPDLLYERKRLPDGVYQTPEKFYMQRKLSQLAVECAAQRRSGERDMVDRFGPGAFYLSEPTKKLSSALNRRVVRLLIEGRHDGAVFLAKMSWREWRDLRSFAGLALAWLTLGRARRHLLKLVLRFWRA